MSQQQDDTDGEVDVGDAAVATPTPRSNASDEEDDDDDADENDEEYDGTAKKAKASYAELSNLLNTRLQKLITKAPKECVLLQMVSYIITDFVLALVEV